MTTDRLTLAQVLLERSNSLNLVRLFLASCVIVWHAWPLGQIGPAPAWAYPLGSSPCPASSACPDS